MCVGGWMGMGVCVCVCVCRHGGKLQEAEGQLEGRKHLWEEALQENLGLLPEIHLLPMLA